MPSETRQAWRAAAEAELERLYPGVRAKSIPERIWTNLYVRGLSPHEAAKAADVHAWNKLTPFVEASAASVHDRSDLEPMLARQAQEPDSGLIGMPHPFLTITAWSSFHWRRTLGLIGI